MISESIVFSYCNQFYAIELEHFVTILTSKDFSLNEKNNKITFCLNGEKIKGLLINMARYLGNEVRSSEKKGSIILGRFDNDFFGLEINKIEEMLNIDNKYIEEINNNKNEYVKGIFSFDGNSYLVLNIGKIVEESLS